ncbi:HPF/RaiA family ribosome-associated protein [Ascidiimonas sp. W6]|uniref:HPF/RaiA family ribosome-associated protein n=1 Tax=Ascidiimonas meishanensis TaxID=3128903 RepID=UPI0030ED11D0
MQINFEFVDLTQSDRLEEMTIEKLNKLAVRYDFLIRADVFFKKENTVGDKGKKCNIRLSLPGPRIFAESDEKSFEAAMHETVRDLEVQLKKRKASMSSH